MLRESCTAERAPSRQIVRTDDRLHEQMFGPILADVSRLLWPHKTAAHLASAIGCSERAAEFYLHGQRDWSGDAVAAIVAEICRRHHQRNVRIVARQ